MEWLNIHTPTLDSPEFLGAEPVDRATWLCLLRFCIGQENGGRIPACKDWGDRKWQQMARVTQAEVQRTTELWRWDGDSVRVSFYPSDKEREVRAKRSAARTTNQKRTRSASRSADEEREQERPPEGKGREGEGEGEGEGALPPANPTPPHDLDSSTSPDPQDDTDPEPEDTMGLRSLGCKIHTDELRAQWVQVCKGLTVEQVTAIITEHPEPVMYPREFTAARAAWVARTGWKSPDLAAEQARAEQAGREREERVLAERQKRLQAARVLEARQVSSREGAALLAVIDADVERWILAMSPAAKAALDKVRTAVATGNAPGLYLAVIWRDHPELRALVPVDAPAAQGGAA